MKKILIVIIAFLFLSCHINVIKSQNNKDDIIEHIQVNGKQREYIIHLPSQESNLPLVFSMHGLGGTAAGQQENSQFDVVADREGFIVVYPQAEEPNRAWIYENDIDFISAIIDKMIEDYEIDSYRVYACGHSNGGYFSYYLGAELENRIVAIGPVAGLMPFESEPTRPWRGVPVLHIHNKQDMIVSYDGVPNSIENWVNWNECPVNPDSSVYNEEPEVIKDYYGKGKHDSEVILYTLDNPESLGHFWPHDEHGIESAEVLWDFFSQFDLSPITTLDIKENYINELQTITGESIGANLIEVTIQIQNLENNTFWDGNKWLSNPSWVFATADDGSWGDTEEEWTYNSTSVRFSDGFTYKIIAKATDDYNREELHPISKDFLYDSIPPETEIISGPIGIINYTNVTISWTGFDEHTPSFTYKYKLDGYDSDWSTWRLVEQITYENLSEKDYTFYVKSRDKADNIDKTPDTINFTIQKESNPENNPPTAPDISGTISGKTNESYQYQFLSVDPDEDTVSFFIDWDDGTTSEWTDFIPSATYLNETKSWDQEGTYTIKVKAKDIHGLESEWSELEVSMPKNKQKTFDFAFEIISWILEKFPILKILL